MRGLAFLVSSSLAADRSAAEGSRAEHLPQTNSELPTAGSVDHLPGRSTWPRAGQWAKRAAGWVSEWRQRQRDRQRLSEMNEYMLRDMGLQPEQWESLT